MDKERKFIPRLIAWEITRKCHLACKHCRGGAQDHDYEGELSTGEAFRLLDNIASFNSQIIIILTGGEPMAREDVYDIARYGNDLGLRIVMSPCGTLIDDEACRKIREAGIQRLSISIDGATAESHDAFRGIPGAFDGTMRGIEALGRNGIPFQVNTTVTKLNYKELPKLLELAINIGAVAFHPFLLVPTGRGADLIDMELSPVEYEDVLMWFKSKSGDSPIFFKPTCAPHYHRILRQKSDGETQSRSGHMGSRTQGHPVGHPGEHPGGLSSLSRGCMGGVSFAFISHIGQVQICGFLPLSCGNVRDTNLDFVKIWDESEIFLTLRDESNLQGKCGACEFVKVCAGCRARAYAIDNNYLGEEPFCAYEPKGWVRSGV